VTGSCECGDELSGSDARELRVMVLKYPVSFYRRAVYC
jgi:hypothetical protein